MREIVYGRERATVRTRENPDFGYKGEPAPYGGVWVERVATSIYRDAHRRGWSVRFADTCGVKWYCDGNVSVVSTETVV